MKLTEAFIRTGVAGAERGNSETWAIIHRSRGGFHLSRYSTAQGQRAASLWSFPNLYELLLFARAQEFSEIDPQAEDWQPVFNYSRSKPGFPGQAPSWWSVVRASSSLRGYTTPILKA